VTFTALATGAVVQPYAGLLSDRVLPRYGRRWPLAAGVCLTVVALGGFSLFGSTSVPGLLLTFATVAAAASLAQASLQGWIPDLVGPDRRGWAAGWKGFADVGGATLAFVVLGQVIVAGTSSAIAVVACAVFGAGLVALVLVREPTNAGPARAPRHRTRALCGRERRTTRIRDVLRVDRPGRELFIQLVSVRFLFLLGIFSIGRFLVLAVADRFGLRVEDAAEQTSIVLGVLALVSIFFSPPFGWIADRSGPRPLMVIGALVAAVGTIGLVSVPSVLLLSVVGALIAVGNAAFSTGNWAMLTDAVPAHAAARYMGLANLGTAGAAAAAGLFGPVIDLGNRASQGRGYTVVFLAASALMLTGAATVLRMPNATAAQAKGRPEELNSHGGRGGDQ
jgi:MFS family permease